MSLDKSGGSGSRNVSQFGTQTRVDWESVDEELASVPPEFKDPRFDSLRHVLNILSAVDAEAALEELKAQHGRIEELVDEVVQAYHNGFNKSIHIYSQILRLFSDSKDQVKSLRTALVTAKRRLGSQSRDLQDQWRRSVMLGDVVRLLTDARAVTDIPARLDALTEAKDWLAAVVLLLEGCAKLARQELAKVGALREVRRQMAEHRTALQQNIILEIEARMYDIGQAASQSSEGPERSPHGLQPFGPHHSRHKSVAEGVGAILEGAGGAEQTPNLTRRKRGQSLKFTRGADSAGHGSQVFGRQTPQERALHRRGKSLAPGDKAQGQAKTGKQEPVTSLVTCIAMIGGVAEAQQTLRRRMPSQIRNVILQALREASHGGFPGGTSPGLESRTSGGSPSAATSIPSDVIEAAKRVTERVFQQCLQVMKQMVEAEKALATAKSPHASAGLELLMAQQAQEMGKPAAPGPPVPIDARKEADAAWVVMQTECQRLLSELLGSGPLRTTLSPDLSTAGRAADEAGGAGKRSLASEDAASQLNFSFAVQVSGSSTAGAMTLPATPQKASVFVEAADMRSEVRRLLREALGGHPGGMYLTPHLYRTIVQFGDGAGTVLAGLDKEGGEGGTAGGWFAREDKVTAADRAREKAARLLRSFIEALVAEEFLPQVYIDFRGRVTAMLADEDSFKARGSLVEAGGADGGPAWYRVSPRLPAAAATEEMVKELASWALQMPLFAPQLTGVVENILGRVLDAFNSCIQSCLGNAACKALSESPQLAMLMARESAALQMGSPVYFFPGKGTDGLEPFVASLRQSGYGAGGDTAETDVLLRLLQEQPVPAEAVLSLGALLPRARKLAALANALDGLAGVIERAAQVSRAGAEDLRRKEESPSSARQASKRGRRTTAELAAEGLAQNTERYALPSSPGSVACAPVHPVHSWHAPCTFCNPPPLVGGAHPYECCAKILCKPPSSIACDPYEAFL
eukprot:jgi/Botrbrau1/19611/Bobra.0035s0088.1